jgi:hypothetical protein
MLSGRKMKMSRTRALLLEFCAAGIAIGGGLMLIDFGVPVFIVFPLVILAAWFQMGFFITIWKTSQKIKPKEKKGGI